MRKLLLIRPEPGLNHSAARARILGLDPILLPIFRVEPIAWAAPDPAEHDALLLTSANAVRHAGPQLAAFARLPVHAVGAATAAAAREAGLEVVSVGESDVDALLDGFSEQPRLLHLTGEHRRDPREDHQIRQIAVYRAAEIDDAVLPPLTDLVIAVHSPRAGTRLAMLATARDRTIIAAISPAAAAACGLGWQQVAVAERPDDDSLLALAARLCHTSEPR